MQQIKYTVCICRPQRNTPNNNIKKLKIIINKYNKTLNDTKYHFNSFPLNNNYNIKFTHIQQTKH